LSFQVTKNARLYSWAAFLAQHLKIENGSHQQLQIGGTARSRGRVLLGSRLGREAHESRLLIILRGITATLQ